MNKRFTLVICIILFVQLLTSGLTATLSAQENQSYTIRGKVLDEKGAAVPGANVRVTGTKQGTFTDGNGAFSLTLSAPAVLTITYVGYAPKSVPVDSKSLSVSISLAENEKDKNLSEVVVVGYGTQKKSDITGSVTSIPKARFSELPVTNVLQAIQGVAAGVNITQSSSVPGAVPAAQVRGQNSINASTGPYVVVDGIPLSKTGGTLNDINPNDIASMEILKDASSVAIYGTNGANGVILITTKRGNTGKPVIRYNAYGGVEDIAHILKPRNAQEYVQKYADFLSQTGQTQVNPVPNFGELANYNAGKTTDWVDEATQTGVLQDHNLSISGGSADVKYFISGDYLNQKGVVKGYQYKRTSVRSNLDINVTNFLTVGTSIFFSNNNTDGGRVNLLNATAMSPYGQEFNPDGTYKIYPMNPEQLYVNPMLGLVTDRESRSTNINGNAYGEVKFSGLLQGLKYRLNAGYTYLPTRTGTYVGRAANDLNGTANTLNSENNSYTLENVLSYNKDIKKHHFDFTGLYSNQQRKYVENRGSAVGFVNDELSFNNLGAGATQTSNSFAYRYGQVSQMGRINYSYDSRYLLTVTARRDGSSVFGAKTSKYGVFPSAAIGWNISKEAFMQDVKFVDNLKLRLSHGKSGNEAIAVYRTITADTTIRQPFNGVSTIGVTAKNLGNDQLKWETTTSTNLGLDFAILKSRISGTIDAYKTTTKDILLLRSLPIITGYSNVFDNLGEVDNKGLEITITTKNFAEGNFRWETSVNFATNRNKLVDLYGDKKSDLGNRWFIGQPINVVYDYRMTGVWQTGENPAGQDPGAKPGDLKFADLNGDGQITADDREVLGQTAPKWTGGLTNTFHYKNWNLNIFIQTAQGMTKVNNDLNYGDETGKRNTPAEVGYWTAANQSQTRPALSYNNTRGYGYASDASYTRIKDVTLSYVFSPKILDKLRLGGLTIYASGRNLHTFTNWIGWDPENNYAPRGVINSNIDWNNNYPTVRSFVFGANISLK
jgi:TonB-linked SusC/RagA family outer membrane protein